MTGVWLTTIDKKSSVYNDAEIEDTSYSDWLTCTGFDTPEPKLMHLTNYLTKIAIMFYIHGVQA